MTFNKYTSYQLLILLINPILGFIVSLYFLMKNKYSIFVLSTSIAIVFIYFPLMYDTSSNFYATLQLNKFNVDNYFQIRLYNLIPYYLNEKFSIQFMFVIFIYTSVILYIWFYIFKYFSHQIKTSEALFYMIIFVFSSIIYRSIMDLNRFYLATSLILFIIFLLESKLNSKKQIKIFYSIFFVAFLIHSATAILILFYFIVKKIKNKKFYLIFPIILLALGLFAGPITRYLLNLPFFDSLTFLTKASGYIEVGNNWGERSVRGYELVLRVIEIFIIILLYYKSITLLKIEKNSILIKYTLLLMGLVLFLLSFKSLYERYAIAFFLFSSFIVYSSIIYKKKTDYIQFIILSLFILRFVLVNIIWYGIIFTPGYSNVLPNQEKKIEMVSKPFYYTTFFLLDIKNHGYSDKYIQNESSRGKKFLESHRENPILKNNKE